MQNYDRTNMFYNTNPINRIEAEKAVKKLYKHCHDKKITNWRKGSEEPCENPDVIFLDGLDDINTLVDFNKKWVQLEHCNNMGYFVTKRGYGPGDRVNSAIHRTFSECLEGKIKKKGWDTPLFMVISHIHSRHNTDQEKHFSEWEKLACDVWEQTYACITFKDICYVIDRPLGLKMNKRGLHNASGPALIFRDGSEIYSYEGIKTTENNILHPDQMTLKDIHQHNSRKHFLIDLCGVDRYLEMCKAWKPDVKGKFNKFLSFPKMIVEGDKDVEKEWEKEGYDKMYKDKPYTVNFSNGDINKKYSFKIEDQYGLFYFPIKKHPFDYKHSSELFNKEDRELWDLFDIREMQFRGPLNFKLEFMNGIFSLKDIRNYAGFSNCRHDVVPSWMKVKMFRKQDAFYENEELGYAVKCEKGELSFGGNIELERSGLRHANETNDKIKIRSSLFSGCENVPSYNFDIDLSSDSWEGLLEKWAYLAFNWLGMHEDSSRMP